MIEKKKKITLFLEHELHRQSKAKLALEGGSFQVLLTNLLTEWMGGKRTADSRDDHGGSRYSDDLKMFQWILEHGTSEDRDRIRGSIKTFEEAIRGRSQNPSQSGTHRQAKRGA